MDWLTLHNLDKIGGFLGGVGIVVAIVTYFGQIHFAKQGMKLGRGNETGNELGRGMNWDAISIDFDPPFLFPLVLCQEQRESHLAGLFITS